MSESGDRTDPTPSAPQLPPAQQAPTPDAAPREAPVPLPDAPKLPAGDTPFLPAPTPAAPAAPATKPVFDAKAMVQSQKRVNTDPAYGALPVANPESRAAAEVLRAKARRTRTRNKLISWTVVAVFIGGIGTAGFLAYHAYQDDQERQAEEREAAADGEFAGPLGEQAVIIDTIDELSGGATPSAGGLLDAVDDARDVMGQTELAPTGEPAPVAVVPALGPWDQIGLSRFSYRRYHGAAIDSSVEAYHFVYDTTSDDYAFIWLKSADDGGSRLYGTVTDDWVSYFNAAGDLLRFGRSAQSADPGPDLPQARYLTEVAVLPGEARPFATTADIGPVLIGTSSDDPTYPVQSYLLDVAAFRLSAPQAYADWKSTWTAEGPNYPSFYDNSRAQRTSADPDSVGLDDLDRVGYYFANGEPELTDRALISFALTPDGIVNLAIIVDPVSDFRAEYGLHDVAPELGELITELDGLTWFDAEEP